MIFDPPSFYRRKDIVGSGKLVPSEPTLENWIRYEGFPSGRMCGRIRTWTGEELNYWVESRSSNKIRLAEGMGGHRSGRPRKNPDLTPAA
jgi:hypothetical protein